MRTSGLSQYENSMVNFLNSKRKEDNYISLTEKASNTEDKTNSPSVETAKPSVDINKLKEEYTKAQNAAAGMQKHATDLADTGEESLYAKAEASGDRKEVTEKIQEFVDDYNKMIDGMKNSGGVVNSLYRKQLESDAQIYKADLEKAGISFSKDGKLSVDNDKLEKAEMDTVKKLFAGNESFAGAAVTTSKYVTDNAISEIKRLNSSKPLNSGYSGLGGYNNFGNYNGYNSYSNSPWNNSYD